MKIAFVSNGVNLRNKDLSEISVEAFIYAA